MLLRDDDGIDEAQGHFLALADLLRELGRTDLLGRLAELYLEFRETSRPEQSSSAGY
ncbi:hypothetical protein TPY_3436 [Sulfobacillus acidophilus TPY]|uniref:Uncharacterized protein n=1 Tax=Sulfobacillus acidophilus (strain ATCC 700253 / DSM 10332 / NAL) TaxID=679936 RepID=G8TXL9_SULAD|nr:hypothetical protein TPY_3436 [Sulfobacillus acidophilus TPY]AEW04975.1 hypothetical protein Sulac_1478 [Sulfobacillus acidophilus DSM 10332]